LDTRLSALYSALEQDLWHEVGLSRSFLDLPSCPPDVSYRQFAGFAQFKALGKKFLPKDCSMQDAAAYEKFNATNSRCAEWELKLNTSLDETLYGTFKKVLYEFFHPGGWPMLTNLDTLFERGGLGPGSSIGSEGGDLYTKLFDSQLTYTDPLVLKHYEYYSKRLPSWRMAELLRSAARGDARRVQGSRLSFVPKSTTISRCICVEPVLNMWYQLGVGSVLTERLRSFFGIDLSNQPDRNRDLARRGSVWGDLATVDLESASDSISIKLCRDVLPKHVFDLLWRIRSPMYEYDGSFHRFEMISTMGNGFTFPLQTILFAAMVSAVYEVSGSRAFSDGSCGVFGDDIILHAWAYPRLKRLLDLCGFVVNQQKTFTEGPFRESCGKDYYDGNLVRGVYAGRLDTDQDLNALLNGLVMWGCSTGIPIPRTVALLQSLLKHVFYVPPTADPSAGVRVPLELVKRKRLSRDTQAIMYIGYVYVPRTIRIGDCSIHVPRKWKRRMAYNPYGLYLGFLAGMALSSGIPVRDSGKWTTKRRACSYWDTLGPDALEGVTWHRFATYVIGQFCPITR
jgi:hypothetical protein